MKWKLDQFDTALFGVPSFKSTSPLMSEGKGFFTCFVSVDPATSATLSDHGFRLISIRNTYALHDATHVLSKDSDVTIEEFKGTGKVMDEEMTQIGKAIWEFSRYRRDSEIPVKQSLSLYKTWVENSLYHGYADKCLVAMSGKKIVGLCTVKIKESDGYIDLLGVLPEHQRKHIGSHLIDSAITYLRKRAKRILVVTEGENIPANRLYQSKGFVIGNVELVYHKHV